MHGEFAEYGSAAIKLIEECSEVQKVCCKIERFGLDDFNPLKKSRRTSREKQLDELNDLENTVKNMRDWMDSIPEGSQRYRKDGEVKKA